MKTLEERKEEYRKMLLAIQAEGFPLGATIDCETGKITPMSLEETVEEYFAVAPEAIIKWEAEKRLIANAKIGAAFYDAEGKCTGVVIQEDKEQ